MLLDVIHFQSELWKIANNFRDIYVCGIVIGVNVPGEDSFPVWPNEKCEKYVIGYEEEEHDGVTVHHHHGEDAEVDNEGIVRPNHDGCHKTGVLNYSRDLCITRKGSLTG